MSLSSEEQIVTFFGGVSEDWRLDPVRSVYVHWTGLQVTLQLMLTMRSQPQWVPLLTGALQRYIDGLPVEDREQRQHRFQAWKEFHQFSADFGRWLREKLPMDATTDEILHYVRGRDDTGQEQWGPGVPPALVQRWIEGSRVDADFRESLFSHPLVMTCYTNQTDGTPERCEVTEHPYMRK